MPGVVVLELAGGRLMLHSHCVGHGHDPVRHLRRDLAQGAEHEMPPMRVRMGQGQAVRMRSTSLS